MADGGRDAIARRRARRRSDVREDGDDEGVAPTFAASGDDDAPKASEELQHCPLGQSRRKACPCDAGGQGRL